MLIVVAIIGILAGLTFPVLKGISRTRMRTKALGELKTVENAIKSYKAKLGYYPPDNSNTADPNHFWKNQLFYELMGAKPVNANTFSTLDGTAQVSVNTLQTALGAQVSTLVNCTSGSGDEGRPATQFIKPNPALSADVGGLRVLTSSLAWPSDMLPPTGVAGVTPFYYNSSAPVNNRESFDLWVDIIIDHKTNRICNWTEKVLLP
jgi:type II secretory pathway pseudopilin PulG